MMVDKDEDALSEEQMEALIKLVEVSKKDFAQGRFMTPEQVLEKLRGN